MRCPALIWLCIVKILTEEEIADYHASPMINSESQEYEFSLDDKEQSFIKKRESEDIQIYYRLLLGYFRLKPIKIQFDPIRSELDLKFIVGKYFPNLKRDLIPLTPARKSNIYSRIFAAVGVKPFNTSVEEQLEKYLRQEVRTKLDPRELLDQALDWLDHRDIERPSYRIISQVIASVIYSENSRVKELVKNSLSDNTKDTLTSLLQDAKSKDVFDAIRYQSTDFRPSQVNKETRAYVCLSQIYEEIKGMVAQLKLSKPVIEYYATLFNYHDAWEHKRSDPLNFYLYFSCFICLRFTEITDYFVLAFDYHYKNTHASAKEFVKKRIISEREGMAELMIKVGEVLDLHGSAKVSDLELRKKSEKILPSDQRVIVAKYLKSINVDEEVYYWEYIDSIKDSSLKILRKVFKFLKFVEPSSKLSLFVQVMKLKLELDADGKCQTFDDRLIYKKNRVHLYDEEKSLISHRAEYYIYRLISGRLSKAHWGVENSSEFSPLEESLVDLDVFEKDGDTLIEAINSVNLDTPIETLLAQKHTRLNELKKRVLERIISRENESVILSTTSGKKTWTVKQMKGSTEVNDRIFLNLPKRGISSVIAIVARETGFYERIRHIKHRQKDPGFSGKLISCLIANATRLGVHKMADLCPFSYDELKNFESNYLRASALENAADCISDEIAKLGIFKYYNFRPDVIHGSIDGQKFRSRRNTVRTRYSSKDFGKGKGLSALTLSINHVPVNVEIMPLNHHESHYTFDLLYNNTSQLRPDVVSTDTHGTNKCNFAILDLFGWIFAPRYRDVASELDKMFSVSETKKGLSIELAKPIDDQKIVSGWKYTQRICVSLHQKEVKQYEIVKKISRSTKSDKMLDALREYDSLVKAIYLLEYVDDDNLKRYVQKALNRGEAYHQLQKAISKVNGPSSFRGKSDREIDVWYSCARLLANCTIFYNSALMSNALSRLEEQNKGPLADALKKISPVAWEHLVFNGEYPLDDIVELPSILDLSLNILNE